MPSNNSDNYNNSTSSTPEDERAQEKAAQQEAANKAAKTIAKGAATYYGGEAGGAAVDALAKTKLGQAAINQGGKALNNMPGIGKAAKQLDDAGVIDMADKAIGNAAKEGTLGPKDMPSNQNTPDSLNALPKPNGSSLLDDDKNEKETDLTGTGTGSFDLKKVVIPMAVLFSPFLLVILLVFAIASNLSIFFDAYGISQASGGPTGGDVYYEENGDAQAFYVRVNEVKLGYEKSGKYVDALKVVSVYHIISQYNGNITYNEMKKRQIEQIADAMFDGNTYSDEVFKQNLTNTIFKKYFPKYTQEERQRLTDEVFQYISSYFEFIGQDQTTNSTCSQGGSCVYNIKGFYIPSRGNISKNISVNNLKVRLMQCGGDYGSGTWGQPLDEDLVDFEKYILGVAYQEIGPSQPDEATKAQLVAARSFALSRPTQMGNANGKKLAQENNQWILQMSPCVADQVYCDPDKGCSSMNDGKQHGTMRSGLSYHVRKQPMSQDNKMRSLAKSVEGEVLVNNQGNIINASYTSVEQNKFINLAKQGLDYKQILLSVYSSKGFAPSDLEKMNCGSSENCTNLSTGEYKNWIQYKGPWKDVKMGGSNSTIGQIGCLVTSISKLIAKSGVPTNVNGEFNPGSFVTYLNSHGGFAAGGNLLWASVSKAAPNFVFVNREYVLGRSREQKLNRITELQNQGYYVVVEVKGNTGQHWVAIDGVQGSSVVMMDPSTTATDLWSKYPWYNTSAIAYFKVVK